MDKYFLLASELKKKTVEHDSNYYTNCNWCTWYNQQRIGTNTGGVGTNGAGVDYPNYGIIENGQNTEKCPEDLRRLAVTQTPVENHLLTLMWKTLL